MRKWLRRLALHLTTTSITLPANRRRCYLEELEPRIVPDTYAWTGAAKDNGQWTTAGNWFDETTNKQAAHAPGIAGGKQVPDDRVVLRPKVNGAAVATGDITLSQDLTIASLAVQATYNGTLTLEKNLTVTGNLQMSSGNFTINGDGTLTLGVDKPPPPLGTNEAPAPAPTGTGKWTAGTMEGAGKVVVKPTFTLYIAPGQNAVLGRVMDNSGIVAVQYPNAIGGSGTVTFQDAGKINNLAGGTLKIGAGAIVDGVGLTTGGMSNAGTLLIGNQFGAQPQDVVKIDVPFTNTGTVKMYTTVAFGAGGTLGGTFENYVKQSQWIVLGSAADLVQQYTLSAGLKFNAGEGWDWSPDLAISNAKVTIAKGGDISLWRLYLTNGGQLLGDGSMSIIYLNWQSGTMSGTGTTTVVDTATIGGPLYADLGNAVPPVLVAKINEALGAGNGAYGATLARPFVMKEASKYIQGTATLMQLTKGAGFQIAKGGSFTLSKGTTFNIIDGSTITGDGTFNDNGTLNKSGNGKSVIKVQYKMSTTNSKTNVNQANLEFTNLEKVDGTVSLLGNASIQVAGALDLEGGTLDAYGSASVLGSVVNNGVVSGMVPGDPSSIGELSVSGYYTQSTGALNIGIGGTTQVSQYDLLDISGSAQLGGTLNILLANGFTPSVGQSFQVIDYSSYSGTFQTVNGLQIAPGLCFQVQYTSTAVYLVVVASSSAPAPVVSSVSPSTGSTQGGISVTIAGSNFTNISAVSFGSVAATSFTVNSSTSITAVAPANAVGTDDITVTGVNGTSATSAADQFTYTAGSAPTVTAVSPNLGGLAGNDVVTITGTNFQDATGVMFGTVAAPSFIVNSPTQITVTSPAGQSAGSTVNVTVQSDAGTSATSSADQFTYDGVPVVSSLGTTSGSSAGGTQVVINGSGFTDASDVSFGSVAANFVVNSDDSITATAPAMSAGTYDVTVTTDSGTSALSSSDQFTVTAAPAPAVSSLSASSGTTAGGTLVTITGTNLGGASAVDFGGVLAQFYQESNTAILAVAPAQPAGTVDVQVVTPTGTSSTSGADQFTYSNASAPTVTSLGTTSGSTGGGTSVTVFGSGFTDATAVNFGSVPATSYTVLSATTLVATAPAQAAGTYDITVTTNAATSSTSSADQYTYDAAPAPTVSGVTPNSGSAVGGDTILITGANFTGASAVTFGGVAAGYQVLDDNDIEAFAPAGSGTVDVQVTTPSGTSSTSSADQFTYTAVSAPIVTSLSTNSGSTAGGTQVVLTGSGFSTATEVDFGTVPVYDFTVNSDSQLTVIAPPQYAGTVNVSVDAAGGTSASSSATQFTYSLAAFPVVTSLSTSSGTTAGGTTVTISGSGFTGATDVTFGGVDAASFTVNSDGSITAVSPSQAAGTYDIQVDTFSGSSAPVSADQFTVSAAATPTVSGLATTSGSSAGGTLVSITGSGFTGATAVNFGTVSATFTVNSDGSITAWAPAQAAGTVDVTVTTFAGTSATSSADQFTYTAASAPSISSVAANSGSTLGGDTVVILGSGFTAATNVTFGGVAAQDFTVLSDNAIEATTPMLAAGTVNVQVTTPSGTSSISSADQFTYTNVTAPAPTVTAVSPNTAATAGGQEVVITGSNFAGATAVDFGSSAASSFTIDSDTQITAVAPSGSAGTVNITVTTNNGTSATSSADQFTFLATPAPTVTSLGTTSGSTAGDATITITGTNFSGATAVTFGGIEATSFTVNSDTSITAISPASPAGTVDVQVETPSGTSAISNDQFTYIQASAPVVTSLGTTSGSTAGGTSVTIDGNNLGGTVEVDFGGVASPFVTVVSDTEITAITPASFAGTVDVVVITTAGTSLPNSSDQFTFTAASPPVITGLGTTSGSTAGGTSMVITGSGFTGASDVQFGGVDAASFTVDSDTEITAVTPAEPAGTVAVTVWTPTGTSAVSGTTQQFTFTSAAAPTVTGLGTTSGSTGGGTTVNISGSGFTGATAVNFGNVSALSFTVNSDGSITAVAPPQAAATVDVTVSTYAGTSTTSSADQFTYTAASAPAITSVSPSSGSTAGGSTVVITGSYFTGASEVTVGGVAAAFTVLNDNAISLTTPGGSAGTVDIQVTTPSGSSALTGSDQFTYTAVTAPIITSLSVTSGSTAGGTTLTINGSGFTNATSVTIDGIEVPFVVLSDSSLSVTTLPNSAGTYPVVVSIPGAESAPASFTFTATASAPTVMNLGTTSGSTAGGTTVTINGSGFTGASDVTFGGVDAISFTVNSNTSITAVAPAAAGTVAVVVTTPSGTSAVNSGDQFTYTAASAPTLSSLSLTSGSTTGGVVVNLIGSGFTGATSVNFGTTSAAFTVMSDTWITAVVPTAASAGTVGVSVTSAGGTSSALDFTYSAPSAPSVSGLSQTSGLATGSDSIVVLGSGFTGATAVSFGATAATSFEVLSDSALEVVVPAGTALSTVNVEVTTAAGTSAAVAADQYSYNSVSAPTVTGLSSSSGSAAGGTVVVISGTGFSADSQVYFGNVLATTVVVNSSTEITAVVPASVAGTVAVTVTNDAGTSSTSPSDQFTFDPVSAPAVSSISTNTGSVAGGNSILITGSNFTGATAVYFGSTEATSFTVLSPTEVVVTAPPDSSGTVNITVSTPGGGTSSASPADEYTFEDVVVVSTGI